MKSLDERINDFARTWCDTAQGADDLAGVIKRFVKEGQGFYETPTRGVFSDVCRAELERHFPYVKAPCGCQYLGSERSDVCQAHDVVEQVGKETLQDVFRRKLRGPVDDER